jgi:biopolymer transport protein ExbD
MVDIIFCLCVFFMCSMKFKELEGKFESWLPKDKGQSQPMQDTPIEEIRVALFWNEADRTTLRKFGNTTIRDDTQLQELIRDAYAGWVRLGKPQTPAIIDAAEMVPWNEVVRVVNLAKREKIEKIEFAAGKDYEAKK